jgi:hypothetical protein
MDRKIVLRRHFLFIAAALVVLLAASAIYWQYMNGEWGHEAVRYEERDGMLLVDNGRYEIAFDASAGGIVHLKDHDSAAADPMIIGNREGALWRAFLDSDASHSALDADSFQYAWNDRDDALTLKYGGRIQVEVSVRFASDSRIRMNAEVTNGTEEPLQSFRFPHELKAEAANVQDGLLPMLPGAKLKPSFFAESNSYEGQYPGIMFAPFLALRTMHGQLSLYDLEETRPMAMLNIGFKNQVDDAGKTAIVHQYHTWVEPGASWRSPIVVLEVGGGYEEAIASFRELSGIGAYRSLHDKLGEDKAYALGLPFLKMDVSAIPNADWSGLRGSIADRLPYPAVLHPVGFQNGGHDESYPDFIPADTKYGSAEEMRAFVGYAKEKGHRVVPYTNFSWWSVNAPTLKNLPEGLTLEQIAVNSRSGMAVKEDYGSHSGYVMNIGHPYVQERISAEHDELLEIGMDGIFEDQWGIRNAPYDYGDARVRGTDPSTGYYEGMRQYFAAVKHPMYTEDGFDRLANDTLGFMGSNYLWDLLGYRPNTAGYTDYYPMAGMLLRDKVILYQHDLAAETMTDDKDMLRWNAAMGYQLSGDLFNGAEQPWLQLIGVFQREVLSRYGDALVRSFEQLAPQATSTDFGEYRVTANWNGEHPYAIDDAHELAAGGFAIEAKDGTVRAGLFTRYNGRELDPGEHYLAEIREADAIRVYQPVGADTTLLVKKPKGWKYAAASAYDADGSLLAKLPALEEDGMLRFDYIGSIDGRKTAYIALMKSDTVSGGVASTPYRKQAAIVNLAEGADAVSTTDAAEAYAAALAVDGDPYTYWESLADKFPQSITIDLGEPHAVGKLALSLVPQEAWEKREQMIEISVSTDGVDYRSLAGPEAVLFDPAAANRAELALPAGIWRYLRVTVTGNSAWPAAQLSEIEAYAP